MTKKRAAYDAGDDVPEALRPHYEILLDTGHIVWGTLAQVNTGMFLPGPNDLPGETVYSTDAYFDDHPRDLAEIGRAAFALKNTEPVDRNLQRVAALMTNEYDRTPRQPLPRQLTEGREVFLAITIFHRSCLPNGIVSARVFPLLIDPGRTEANMILPMPYWSDLLQGGWDNLDEKLAALPVTSTARQVALDAEKETLEGTPSWDVETTPLSLTPAAAAKFRRILSEHDFPEVVYLLVGIHTDGERAGKKRADIAPSFHPTEECCFESQGVQVVVRLDHLEQMRGAIVDYQDSIFGSGFSIRLADEQ
jgi:Fe-S cluster assembly iron-binding protein IscA